MHKKENTIKDSVPAIITFILLVLIWEGADYILKIREIVLPNPHEILQSIITNFSELIKDTYVTLLESILGFLVGSTLAVIIAILFVYSTNSMKALYPYVIAIKAAPIYALAPLLLLWFGNGITAKVMMSALVAFFPVLVSSIKGFTAVDQEAMDLFKSLSATKTQVFCKLRLFNALGYIFPSLKVASTFAIVGATISEFTGASEGIGHLIITASYYLDTSLLFAGVIMISVAGTLLFYLIGAIENKVVFWNSGNLP
jgi:NitT/TauT family transport system permease protein